MKAEPSRAGKQVIYFKGILRDYTINFFLNIVVK